MKSPTPKKIAILGATGHIARNLKSSFRNVPGSVSMVRGDQVIQEYGIGKSPGGELINQANGLCAATIRMRRNGPFNTTPNP